MTIAKGFAPIEDSFWDENRFDLDDPKAQLIYLRLWTKAVKNRVTFLDLNRYEIAYLTARFRCTADEVQAAIQTLVSVKLLKRAKSPNGDRLEFPGIKEKNPLVKSWDGEQYSRVGTQHRPKTTPPRTDLGPTTGEPRTENGATSDQPRVENPEERKGKERNGKIDPPASSGQDDLNGLHASNGDHPEPTRSSRLDSPEDGDGGSPDDAKPNAEQRKLIVELFLNADANRDYEVAKIARRLFKNLNGSLGNFKLGAERLSLYAYCALAQEGVENPTALFLTHCKRKANLEDSPHYPEWKKLVYG